MPSSTLPQHVSRRGSQGPEQGVGLGPPLLPLPSPAQPQPKERPLCTSSVFLSFFSFPSKQNCLAAAPASVPKAVPKGPSPPAEVMAVILLMGSKMDGARCPKCTQEASGICRPGEKESVAGTHPPLGPY